MTFGERLDYAKQHPTGFDYIRLILAAAVITQHGVNVTQGVDSAKELFFSNWRLLIEPILPIFFALSGFLVGGSLLRCRSLISFVGLRVLRIVPALSAEVVLSAFIFGPLLTSVTLREYFASGILYKYMFNVIGYIHYTLPGVFVSNPWPNIVNTQLWTIPFELECYAALSFMAFVGIVWRRRLFVGVLALIYVLMVAYFLTKNPEQAILVNGRILVYCFLVGVAFYLYRDKIPSSALLFIVALVGTVICVKLPGGEYLIALPANYLTAYVGLFCPKKPKIFFSGDYSYGMYLYGFPVQQVVVTLIPRVPWWMNVVISLVAAFVIAHCSWWFLEKPALSLKNDLLRFETAVLSSLAKMWNGPLLLRFVSRNIGPQGAKL
jgi:peptidoglycan/LPS O-acetylase OafA/YrhL